MLRRATKARPSPAMVVALLALIAACTGTVVAASNKSTKKLVDKRIDGALDLSSQSFAQPLSLANDGDFANAGTLNIKGPASSYMVTVFAQIDTSGCAGPANATGRVTFDGQSFATYPDMTITVPPSAEAPIGLGGLIDPDSYGSKKKPQPYAKGKSHAISFLVKVTGGVNQPPGCAEVVARNINAVRLSE